MSRFPKLTETFVLYEMLAVEELGVDVHIHPLLREREPIMHPEAPALVRRAHYLPFLSVGILRSQWHFLRRSPRAYVGALQTMMQATWGSPNFFFGGLAIFPKVAHMALQLQRRGINHVHCHFANHPALAGFLIHRLVGIPYSFTAHGSDLHVDRHMLTEKVRESAATVAISHYNRRLIESECAPLPQDRVRVIHTGVDTTAFVPHGRERPPGPFRILCVGTLHEVKGQRYLVEACELLRDRGITVECRFIGEGRDRQMLTKLIAERRLGDTVTLDGSRSRAEVISALARTDVLVAPSVPTTEGKREGIPMVLMEAMSTGVPVVASRISGIPELIEDGEHGILTPPGDSAMLADAIRRLAEDADLRGELGRAARRRVVEEFDLRQNAARLVAMFEELAQYQPGRQRMARSLV